MNDRMKEKIVKFSVIMMAISILFSFASQIFIFIYKNDSSLVNLFEEMMKYGFIFGLIFCFVFIGFALASPSLFKPKLTRAKTKKLKFGNYDDLIYNVDKTVNIIGYDKVYDKDNIIIWFSSGFSIDNFIVIAKFSKLTHTDIAKVYKIFDIFVKKHYGINKLNFRISVIPIICVNEFNKYFSDYVNMEVRQTMYLDKLPVGISFNDNNVYVAKQNDLYGLLQYHCLKKKFYRLFKDVIEIDNN